MKDTNNLIIVPSTIQFRVEAIRAGLDLYYYETEEDNEILDDVYEDVVKLGEELGCWEPWE